MSKVDSLYRSAESEPSPFKFDDKVARVFPDMISRSVPGYSFVLSTTIDIAIHYIRPNTYIYDLGCASGQMLGGIQKKMGNIDYYLVAVDSSPDMLSACQDYLNTLRCADNVEFICAEAQSIVLRPSSVIILNYTLQFVPLLDRVIILRKIYDALITGGVLILTEKCLEQNCEHQAMISRLHGEFKKDNGYNNLEIAQKRKALENVLIPETVGTHLKRLKVAGFQTPFIWAKLLGFTSFLAMK